MSYSYLPNNSNPTSTSFRPKTTDAISNPFHFAKALFPNHRTSGSAAVKSPFSTLGSFWVNIFVNQDEFTEVTPSDSLEDALQDIRDYHGVRGTEYVCTLCIQDGFCAMKDLEELSRTQQD